MILIVYCFLTCGIPYQERNENWPLGLQTWKGNCWWSIPSGNLAGHGLFLRGRRIAAMASGAVFLDEGPDGLGELLFQPGIGGLRATRGEDRGKDEEVATQHRSPVPNSC